MSDLLVIEFPSEEKAEGVREVVLAMQQENAIEPGDAVVAVKDANGRVKLNRLLRPAAPGTLPPMLWEALIGLLSLSQLTDAARGALRDVGLGDDFIQRATRTLRSGNAALLLLIRKMTTDKVLAALRGVGGAVLRSSFDETKEEALRAALAGPAPRPGERDRTTGVDRLFDADQRAVTGCLIKASRQSARDNGG